MFVGLVSVKFDVDRISSPWCGAEVSEEVPAQVTSSSSDQGSELRDNTAVFQIGTNMSAIQDLEGKFTGKFSGSTLKKSKPAICLRDHGIHMVGKIKFGVKDDTKISDCI
ncbi:hypothetical protein AVEN_179080-1 [Araneus ventricosus]|uniref:Uncharacterized protein n=1 Tax=Araneus ventricosus TaxID=182803 RepID=A0A4Y2R7I6_ARAVE|nr:hypothetical protein AVEN_102456-1 [Araneus ventricosus]GBO06036.1 hypothetical protein AVEN_179080-1 [Araneus ventricosus]